MLERGDLPKMYIKIRKMQHINEKLKKEPNLSEDKRDEFSRKFQGVEDVYK